MEVGNLVELRHPHVVRLVGFGHDDEECVFVMELMDGNMRSCIDAKPFTASETLDIITQIAKGMYFMHTKGYAHGDLKCSNLLVKRFGESQEVKISDLRGSQSLDKAWDPEAFRQASLTRRPRWTAPEAIDHYNGVQPPTELLKQSDVYSFGMACFEVVTGKYPFHGVRDEPLLAQIKEGAEKWNSFPSEMDKDLKGLIISCWNKDPKSFETVCHILDTIRSKKLAAENNTSCGVTVPGMLMQLCTDRFAKAQHVPQIRGRRGNEPGKVEFFRSNSVVIVPDHLMITPEQLARSVTPIGEGSHGRVFKATWLGCTFAVKIQLCSATTLVLQQEVDFLVNVSRHPCIVQMVGLSLNPDGEHSIVITVKPLMSRSWTLVCRILKSIQIQLRSSITTGWVPGFTVHLKCYLSPPVKYCLQGGPVNRRVTMVTCDYAAVRKGQYSPKWPSNPRPEVKSLIAIVERCWCMAPADRPTFIQICKDLQDIFKSSLVLNAT